MRVGYIIGMVWEHRLSDCVVFCSVPSTVVAHMLQKLGLSDEGELQYPDLAVKIRAVRKEACKTGEAW